MGQRATGLTAELPLDGFGSGKTFLPVGRPLIADAPGSERARLRSDEHLPQQDYPTSSSWPRI